MPFAGCVGTLNKLWNKLKHFATNDFMQKKFLIQHAERQEYSEVLVFNVLETKICFY